MIKEYDIVISKIKQSKEIDIGCIGTVLIIYDNAYEVEFVDNEHNTIDVLTVDKDTVDIDS